MDKRKKMLAAIDPSQGIGLEIGPLDSPIVTREMGNVRYVDHASTEDLRVKNRYSTVRQEPAWRLRPIFFASAYPTASGAR